VPGAVLALLSLVLGHLAFSQVRQIALLSPNTGWAQVDNNLFYTADNGETWADITPLVFPGERLEAAFSLKNGRGWVIVSQVDSVPGANLQRTLATTADNGAHWAMLTFQVRGTSIPAGASPTSLAFVDELHGWLMLRRASNSNFSFGVLFTTQDGGITWEERPVPPASGRVFFLNMRIGWLVGGPRGGGLWMTHDGGNRWTRQDLDQGNVCAGCKIFYDLPVFRDPQNGLLTATATSGKETYSLTYASHDGGLSWYEQSRWREKGSAPNRPLLCAAGLEVIRVGFVSGNVLSLAVGDSEFTATIPAGVSSGGSVIHSQFADESNGWLLYSAGRCLEYKTKCSQQSDLLVTVDGGKTLRVITPGLPAEKRATEINPFRSANPPGPARNASAIARSTAASPQSTGIEVSQHTGFDLACAPSSTNLTTFFDSSSYRDLGVYIGGCNVSCAPPNGQNPCGTGFVPGNKPINSNLSASWVAM
jgi:photosystem II stability/assembly factor-like uncharacterized protein